MMQMAEEKISESEKNETSVSEAEFDWETEYSDDYYESYIESFVPNKKKRYVYRFLKRSGDILLSLLALILFSPVMLVIAIAIKLDSKGPVIFKQKRMGKGGKPFHCYKFRSMKVTAPRDCATSNLKEPEKHLTRVGKFIRKLSLDELPQFFCCLIGTMSIIGPRPLVLTEEKCNNMRLRLGVFEMRPGISGYAQVKGRDDVYYKNKAIMDAYYVKHASVWFDIKLMIQTVTVVVSRKGNHSAKREGKK